MEVRKQIESFSVWYVRQLNLKIANTLVMTRTSIHNMSTRWHSAVRKLLKSTNRSCKRKISHSSHSTQYLRNRVIECEHSLFQKSMISSWTCQHERSCRIVPGLNPLTSVWVMGFWGWRDLSWLNSWWCHFCIVVLSQGHTKTTRSEERRVGKECRSRWSPDH